MTLVVDASALIEVVLGLGAKPWVLEQIGDDDLRAPSHQPAEVLSAAARLARAGTITRRQASLGISEYSALTQTFDVPDRRLLLDALALDGQLRLADALYVVLASRLGVPLITTDRRLAAADPPCDLLCPR